MRRGAFVSWIVVLVLGALPAAADTAGIAARADGWTAAFNAGDVEAIVALYTDEAHILPPNEEMGHGHDAVRASLGAMVAAGLTGALETVALHVEGNTGYRVGTYAVHDGAGSLVDRGKFVEVWKKVDGEWMIDADIWNSSLPAAGAVEDEAESQE